MTSRKSLLMWRLGGVGDILWGTAGLPILSKEADIDVVANDNAEAVYLNNPHIRTVIRVADLKDPDGHPITDPGLDPTVAKNTAVDWWTETIKSYDYSVSPWGFAGLYLWRNDYMGKHREWYAPKEERQSDRNFIDIITKAMGLKWITGLLPSLYPTADEAAELSRMRAQHAGQKVLLWHTCESAYNKMVPQAVGYVSNILERHPDVVVWLAGKDHRTFDSVPIPGRCLSLRNLSLRMQLLLPSVVDCVVGPESAITNASAAWNVPKVIFYSHSKHENLSRDWWNAYPIYPDATLCPCAPCYRIVDCNNADEADCPVYEGELNGGGKTGLKVGAKCCVHLPHADIYQTIANILNDDTGRHCPSCGAWKNKHVTEGVFRCVCGATFGPKVLR